MISAILVGTDNENREPDVGGCEKGAGVMEDVVPLRGIGAVSVNEVATGGCEEGVGPGPDVSIGDACRSFPLGGDDSALNRDVKLGGLDGCAILRLSLPLPDDQDAFGPPMPVFPSTREPDPLRVC